MVGKVVKKEKKKKRCGRGIGTVKFCDIVDRYQ